MIQFKIQYTPKYFAWAMLQHSIVFAAVWFIPVPYMVKAWLGIIVFTLAHMPNWRLFMLTGLLSIVFYPLVVLCFEADLWRGIGITVLMLQIHALVGSYLEWRGTEMRVLWWHPKWRK